MEFYPDLPVTWDTLARCALHPSPAGLDQVRRCRATYEKGIEALDTEEKKSQLLELFLDTLFSLGSRLEVGDIGPGGSATMAFLAESAELATKMGEGKGGILKKERYKHVSIE